MTGDAAAKTKLPDSLASALRRLAAALDRLDAANEHRAQADAMRANFEEELAIMQDDRSRLAAELDSALARVKLLELANDEASLRLNRASEAIKAVLAGVAAREG